jgi:hypothetical protein
MTDAADSASAQIEQITDELKTLRKGRGIQAHALRLGQHLQQLAGGDAATRRDRLSAQLNGCAAQLPNEMSLAVTASLGLRGQTMNMPHFRDRVDWLADQIGRDYRTALRRVDAAQERLAEVIAGELRQRSNQAVTDASGWYLAHLQALLRLDTPTPQSQEVRRIAATRSGLTEVRAWGHVPHVPGRPPPRVTTDVVYGGSLVTRERPNPDDQPGSRFEFFVRLPRPLEAGEEHEFSLITRLNPGTPMRSHYLVIPECRCDALDLRVRFGSGQRPGWVRRVEGETFRFFDPPRQTSDLIEPDAAGEIRLTFGNLTMYLGYGAQWQP